MLKRISPRRSYLNVVSIRHLRSASIPSTSVQTMVLPKPTLLDSTDMVRDIKELPSEYEEEKKEKGGGGEEGEGGGGGEGEERGEGEEGEEEGGEEEGGGGSSARRRPPRLLFLSSELAESIAAGESAHLAFGVLGKLYDIGYLVNTWDSHQSYRCNKNL
jgi:hypothetical protein